MNKKIPNNSILKHHLGLAANLDFARHSKALSLCALLFAGSLLSSCGVLELNEEAGATKQDQTETTKTPPENTTAEQPDNDQLAKKPVRAIPDDALFPLLVAEFATRRNQLDRP